MNIKLEFEKWVNSNPDELEDVMDEGLEACIFRVYDDEYSNELLNVAWKAWKAAHDKKLFESGIIMKKQPMNIA